MGKNLIFLFLVFFIFIAILSTGCTLSESELSFSESDSYIPNQHILNSSVHVLTPEMESQAIAIALNSSEIKYYRDNQIDFQIQSVFRGGIKKEKTISTIIYSPVVKIKTKNATKYLYIDLEKQEIFFNTSTHNREDSAPLNTSAHILTPEMRSQAIAIALNDSKIQNYRNNRIAFEIESVVLPERPYMSFIGTKMYERYFPVIRIQTPDEYLNMYIDLENNETHAIERFFTRSDFSNDPDVLAILAAAPEEERFTEEQMTNDTYLETYEPPCSKLIAVLRKKNATYDQISALLELNGYYWIPGNLNQSCGKGYAPSAEEKELWAAVRGPGYNPYGR